MLNKLFWILIPLMLLPNPGPQRAEVGETIINKWQYGKQSAVSLTFDDSTINQFRVAMPLIDQLGFPGTFYLVTGAIPGSTYKPRFVGRPVEEIIEESGEIPTNKNNFFERASAIRFLGYEGTYQYHNQAASYYGRGELTEAYKVIDEGFEKVRNGNFPKSNGYMDELYDVLAIEDHSVDLITWDKLQNYAENGHEFGSHTILHPWLAVMDSANIHYELRKSREDILNHLGTEHTFSAECPFGTEDERVMHHAHQIFPALRNRMPHPWLAELNRSSEEDPTQSPKEYVQWQRGPLSDTPMSRMKGWVDTSLETDNTWLVLVFHGVQGIGWEPLTREELDEYFSYIKEREKSIWVATFRDVTKYMRQRMSASIETSVSEDRISVELTHALDANLYDLPLTLTTRIPAGWNNISVNQDGDSQPFSIYQDDRGRYVQYQASPNQEPVFIQNDR